MASPQFDSDGSGVNIPGKHSSTEQQDNDYGNALTALTAAERTAQQDPEHNPPVGINDPNWQIVYAHLIQLSREDSERGAEEALKVRRVVTPDSPIANTAHQIFRENIDALEEKGQTVTAMNLLGKDIAPGQDKGLSGPLGSGGDNSGVAALSKYKESFDVAGPSGVSGKISIDASTTDPNPKIPLQSTYPLTENEQRSDTGEYLRLASNLNAESQQNLVAVTHSLAGVLSSNADPTKDPGKTGVMWELLGQDATKIYQEDQTAPGLSAAQVKQIQNDKGQTTHDLEVLVAALRRDEQKSTANPGRMAFDESQIQMIKAVANDAGNVIIKDGNGTPGSPGQKAGNQQNATDPDSQNLPKSSTPDGGVKGFPVQAHDPSQPTPALNSPIVVGQQAQSSPDLR